MWLFSKNNFLSIVRDKGNPNRLLVRGRLKGDIEAMFPAAEVIEGAGSDYLFRAFVDRAAVLNAVADTVSDLDYTNFKNANAEERKGHLMEVWRVMFDEQEAKKGKGNMDDGDAFYIRTMTDKTKNRYHKDEVVTPQGGISYLKFDMKLVNGVVYTEHENGQLKSEGSYKGGRADGLSRNWRVNGRLWHERNYKDGELTSAQEWDKDGNLTKDETH